MHSCDKDVDEDACKFITINPQLKISETQFELSYKVITLFMIWIKLKNSSIIWDSTAAYTGKLKTHFHRSKITFLPFYCSFWFHSAAFCSGIMDDSFIWWTRFGTKEKNFMNYGSRDHLHRDLTFYSSRHCQMKNWTFCTFKTHSAVFSCEWAREEENTLLLKTSKYHVECDRTFELV